MDLIYHLTKPYRYSLLALAWFGC